MSIPLNLIEKTTECSLVIAFADLSHFSQISEQKTDLALFGFLTEFYECVGEVIESSGGIVLKFIGDCALIVFPAEEAKVAVETLKSLIQKVDAWLQAQKIDSKLRIKAHLGTVVYGLIGTKREKRFDIIGKAVNATALFSYGEDLTLSEELQAAIK